jgi:hypothetical protein
VVNQPSQLQSIGVVVVLSEFQVWIEFQGIDVDAEYQ